MSEKIGKIACTGFIPDALPEVSSSVLPANAQKGVSTHCVRSHPPLKTIRRIKEFPKWYVLRATYGREQNAYDYLVKEKVEAFYPTLKQVKLVNGKKREVTISRIPNIFFAKGTETEMKKYVYDNVNLPFLRFYYRHRHEGSRIKREPLIVPDYQIESLKIICASEATDIVVVPADVRKFEEGQQVRIIDGSFKGVVGRVSRYQGQQRVGVVIDGVYTVATAYIPSAFLEPMTDE